MHSLHNFTSAAGSLAEVISIVPSGENNTFPTPAFAWALALNTTIGDDNKRCVRSNLGGYSVVEDEEEEGEEEEEEEDEEEGFWFVDVIVSSISSPSAAAAAVADVPAAVVSSPPSV